MKNKRFVLLAVLTATMFTLVGCGSNGGSGGDQSVAPPTDSDPQALFVGSKVCQTCHGPIYEDVFESGHPYKLNKVISGQIPSYPFSTINGALEQIADDNDETDNTLGTPTSYDDITYVIGGFGWKARWIDADGYIVTGSEVQYNLEDGSLVSYHNDETDKPYNCGNCHTTGWRHTDDSLNPNRQDNLPGMDGTFVAGGIQCESCHGPGAAHVGSLDASDIVRVATARTTSDFLTSDMGYDKAVACSECHTRDGEKDYPTYVSAYNTAFPDGSNEGGRIAASGGLIKHHEQFDEMLGVDPVTGNELGKHLKAGVDCITCHDPHKTMKHQDKTGASGLKVDCDSCHGIGDAFEVAMPEDSYMGTFDCVSCHMPDITKNAVKHAAVGTGPATGDIATHIFKIDLTNDEQFTADGKFSNPWITKDFACGTCHNGIDAFDTSSTDFSDYTFHKNTVAVDDNSVFVDKYAGSEVCAKCHATNYADFVQSGHPFKVTKVVNDQIPTYPFTDLSGALERVTDEDGITDNTLGTPTSYADVSYVVGGYGWKARWLDKDGFIVTGSEAQYNFGNDMMSSYNDGSVDKPFNCGNCHTTGWQHYDATLNPNRQDDLPGMDGSFALAGVQCESCHGAALLHVVTQDASDVTRVASQRTTADFISGAAFTQPVACGECHTRDGEHDYPTYVSPYESASGLTDQLGGRVIVSGSFAKHHEQEEELLGLDPDNIAAGTTRNNINSSMWQCITCHDPHTTTKFQNDPRNTSSGPGIRTDCTACHTKTFTVAGHANVDCISCHMPKSAKSAITTDSALGPDTFGDIRGHIFTINLDPAAEQLSVDGKFMKPWLTSDFACGTCHANTAAAATLLPASGAHP